ncbi:MAG: RHS repeat protein, partial [Lachnospiraceae bacterium]|nr:RHS repeat protein [Lachnospiraceae bacterium]
MGGLLIVLMIVFLASKMPVKASAAQTPGVVDGVDLDLGGVYYAYPDYVSHYLGTQQKATKRVTAIYATNYDKYYGYSDYLYKTIEYDDKGNLTAIYEVNGSADKVTWTTTFEYDTAGRLIRKNSISSSGELIGWTVYDRDEQGRLTKMSSYS